MTYLPPAWYIGQRFHMPRIRISVDDSMQDGSLIVGDKNRYLIDDFIMVWCQQGDELFLTATHPGRTVFNFTTNSDTLEGVRRRLGV